jgi:hypothetical protein
LVLTTTAVSAFVTYASAFLSVAPTHPYDGLLGTPSANSASLGFASYLVTTMLLVVPLLMVYRWRAVPGTATGLVGAVALFAMATFEFPMPQTVGALAATVAASVVDVILVRLEGSRVARSPLRLPVAGALFAALVWSAQLLGLHLGARILWSVQLSTGTVAVTALMAALLGMLVEGSRAPRRSPAPDAYALAGAA